MSADNRGGGVTYRERKKKEKDGDPGFLFGFAFLFACAGRVGLPTGKEKEGRRLAFFLALLFFFLLLTRDGWWWLSGPSLVGYWVQRVNCETCWVGPGGVGTDGGGGYLIVYLLVVMLNAWPGIAFFFLLHFLSLLGRPHFILGTLSGR